MLRGKPILYVEVIGMNVEEFVEAVVKQASRAGYTTEINRNGQRQIDFGHKKLHEGHLNKTFPEILNPGAKVAQIIELVAPGRPCTHRPMREIVKNISTHS